MKDNFLQTYKEILQAIYDLKREHVFNDFDKAIKVEDSLLQPYNTLYYLLYEIKDIQTDKTIISDLLEFKRFLNKYRVSTLIHLAISLGDDLSGLNKPTFQTLIKLEDKDILIQLAKSPYIDDVIASMLLTETYMVLKNLQENQTISKEFKETKLKDYITNSKNAAILKSIVKR